MKRLFILPLIVFTFSCSNEDNSAKVKSFVFEWIEAIQSSNEKSIRRLYSPTFQIPSIIWNRPTGLSLSFNTDDLSIELKSDETNVVVVQLPFDISSDIGDYRSTSQLVLEIEEFKEDQFRIKTMLPSFVQRIKEYGVWQEVTNQRNGDNIIRGDSILNRIVDMAKVISAQYDTVPFFAIDNGIVVFYVVDGNWTYPYKYDDQRDKGDYRVGVVTSENRVIVPVNYDKVYNFHGSFLGMIEVELNGKKGLYTVDGSLFVPVEFDGIYPYKKESNVLAQVRKGNQYGWIDTKGVVHFDYESHQDKNLFRSPVESGLVTEWEFRYPGDLILYREVDAEFDEYESTGLLIYPSYLKDLGITPIANAYVAIENESSYSMGMNFTSIKVEKVYSAMDRLYSLISSFVESGADAREYHFGKDQLQVVDYELNPVSSVKELLSNSLDYAGPCNEYSYKSISNTLFEVTNRKEYKYFSVTDNGSIEELTTNRQFGFTKFVKIDESYFSTCDAEFVDWENYDWSSQKPNMVITKNLSKDQLDIMRNEIFAEYGFKFKTEKWKTYFEDKSWYTPANDNVDHLLTEIDRHNIQFILEYLKRHKEIIVQRDSVLYVPAG
ncbi:MAG: YARHG domain-containing protein [Cyclobacteriaceae bacterium]|nr:MAG: YARHG domain-containing protein [Cyclobacteriaceae bacterium]